MDQYITGKIIKKIRESQHITQAELAEKLSVSNKTISKWETGKGYPDITMLEPLARALGISVIELISGKEIPNKNRNHNMARVKFHVCPVCGNIICSAGEAVISCCGTVLPPLEAEPADDGHILNIEQVEDEYFVSLDHEMTKTHYISFVAAIRFDGYEITKLYPEGNAEARFKKSRTKKMYYYCNRHGLFFCNIK